MCSYLFSERAVGLSEALSLSVTAVRQNPHQSAHIFIKTKEQWKNKNTLILCYALMLSSTGRKKLLFLNQQQKYKIYFDKKVYRTNKHLKKKETKLTTNLINMHICSLC